MMTALLSVGAWAENLWTSDTEGGTTLNWNYFTLPKMSMTAGDVLTFHITSVGADWSTMKLYTTDETKEGWDKKGTELMSLDHRSGSNVIVVVTNDIASAAPDGIIVYGENSVVVSSVDYEKKQATLNLYSNDEGQARRYYGGQLLAPNLFTAAKVGDIVTIDISRVGNDENPVVVDTEYGENVKIYNKCPNSVWNSDTGNMDNPEGLTELTTLKVFTAPTTLSLVLTEDLLANAKVNGLSLGGGNYNFTSVDLLYKPTVSIGSAGYATLGYATALDLTDVDAYTVTVSDGKAQLNSVKDKKIPANTGIILKGSGNVTIPLTTEATDEIGTNNLHVSDGTVTGDGSIYVLANGTSGVGFYKLASGKKVLAGKAYLKISGGAALARPFLAIGNGDDNTTGIDNLTPALSTGEGIYYDLQGRRVAQPTKGLYIVNGKKVVIK